MQAVQQEGTAQVNAAKDQAEQSQAAAQEAKQTATDLYSLLPLAKMCIRDRQEIVEGIKTPLEECIPADEVEW